MTEVVEGEAAALQVLGEDSVPDTRANRDSESYLVNLAGVEHVKGYQYPGTVRNVIEGVAGAKGANTCSSCHRTPKVGE
nr:hypothetical protein [Pseudarthrobacter sp. NS4]